MLAVPIRIELIAVDDCSSDGSRERLGELAKEKGFQVLLQERNQGKGAAVRRGIQAASGAVIVIQDADLEYSLEEPELLDLIVRGKADAVFGSPSPARLVPGSIRAHPAHVRAVEGWPGPYRHSAWRIPWRPVRCIWS